MSFRETFEALIDLKPFDISSSWICGQATEPLIPTSTRDRPRFSFPDRHQRVDCVGWSAEGEIVWGSTSREKYGTVAANAIFARSESSAWSIPNSFESDSIHYSNSKEFTFQYALRPQIPFRKLEIVKNLVAAIFHTAFCCRTRWLISLIHISWF